MARPKALQIKEEWKEKVVEAYRQTGTLLAASKAGSISRITLSKLMKSNKQFRAEMEDAKLCHIDLLESILNKRIAEGKQGANLLLMFKLKAENPSKYRELITQHHEGTIKIVSAVPRPNYKVSTEPKLLTAGDNT